MSNLIDIVIPYGKAYHLENQNSILPDHGELRYCLRSIAKHLRNVGSIYIIGANLPTWLQNVKTYPGPIDTPGANNASQNIYRKLSKAAERLDRFLYMNDDHYLLVDFDARTFPNYYDGTFGSNTPPHQAMTSYRRTMNNTIELIGADAKYYDIHTPLVIEREGFQKLKKYDWTKHGGYCIKSLYAFNNDLDGEQTEDFKIPSVQSAQWLERMFNNKTFFSTHDNCFGNSMRDRMEQLYPDKSIFEK